MRKLIGCALGGLAVASVAVLLGARNDAKAQGGPTFVLSPQQQTVNLSAGTVQVKVQVQNASNVGSFQFRLRYDRGVLSNPSATPGSFLGSAGGSPQCLDPVIDGTGGNDPGTILFGCFGGNGASGSGELATVTFTLAGGSRTSIAIENDTLSDSAGNPLCGTYAAPTCAAQGGSITVNGGDPTKNSGYAPTPTLQAVDTTTPPTRTPGSTQEATPAPGSTSGNSGSSGGATGSTGTGSTSGGSTSRSGSASGAGRSGGVSASSGSGTSVGKYGYGPQPRDNGHRRFALAAAMLSGVLGAALLGAGAKRRAFNVR